jgi:hypothetical protein
MTRDLYEVVENEGWDGVYPKWFATDGVTYEQFDDEQEAQEYCDANNHERAVVSYYILREDDGTWRVHEQPLFNAAGYANPGYADRDEAERRATSMGFDESDGEKEG